MHELLTNLALCAISPKYTPDTEYHACKRNWQGIPGIECASNGRLWATWYTGGRTEDALNHIVLVTSDDQGRSWSEPVLAIDPPDNVRAADPVLWHDPLGKLWLFWMQTYCEGPDKVFDGRGGVWEMHCSNSGSAHPIWSEPRRIANGVMMNKPTVLSTGEWLLPTAIWTILKPFAYNIPTEEFSNVTVSYDNGDTFSLLGSANVPNRGCDEHMIVERSDGSLRMLVRLKNGIGEALSFDRGKNWTAAENPVLHGPGSRFFIRKIASGRLLLIYHDHQSERSHLTAMLSEDEGVTWPYRLLLDERMLVSYPDAIEISKGRIYIIYDRDRLGVGEILFQEIMEEEILEGKFRNCQQERIRIISHLKRMNIGSRRELFLDEILIDQMKGVRIALHHAIPREIALITDKPWEGKTCGYITVLRDDNQFRLYYRGSDFGGSFDEELPHPMWICLAESSDARTWRRMELQSSKAPGSKQDNVIFKGIGKDAKGVHGFTPFIDTNPLCPPQFRYKAVGGLGPEELVTKGDLYALTSSDGIEWTLFQEAPILRNAEHGYFDSQNLAFWDATRNEYRIYFRNYINRGRPDAVRSIRTATSKNFIDWDHIEDLEYPDGLKQQLYTSQIQPYYRAPHIFLGFPTRYVERAWSPTQEALPESEHRLWRFGLLERFGAALTDGLLMSSRDGKTFHLWNEAFLRPGPQLKGNWTYGDNYQGCGLFETASEVSGAPDELSFLVVENYARMPGTIFRRHSIRVDGFASIHAPAQDAELTLVPFWFEGDALELNFSTSAAGYVRVELQDSSGNPIKDYTLEDCHDIVGDELSRIVRWKTGSSIAELSGKLIRMRFRMSDADIYSFRFYKK